MKTRQIEVYRCWDGGTWDTDFVDIPADTPDDRIETASRAAVIAMIDKQPGPNVLCACGVYHVPDVEDTQDD